MGDIFLKLLNMSIAASWLILAVLLLRLLLRKTPKWIHCLLWGFVAVRLICPFSIESAYSLIPSAETVQTDKITDEDGQISQNIRAFNRPGMLLVLTFFSLGTRVTLAYLLSAIPSIEVKGIRWAVPIGWLLADFVGVTYYLCFCRTKLYRVERGGGSSDAETVVYQKRKG